MINSQWLELPMSRTNFHDSKDVKSIEVRLFCCLFFLPFSSIYLFIYLFFMKKDNLAVCLRTNNTNNNNNNKNKKNKTTTTTTKKKTKQNKKQQQTNKNTTKKKKKKTTKNKQTHRYNFQRLWLCIVLAILYEGKILPSATSPPSHHL